MDPNIMDLNAMDPEGIPDPQLLDQFLVDLPADMELELPLVPDDMPEPDAHNGWDAMMAHINNHQQGGRPDLSVGKSIKEMVRARLELLSYGHHWAGLGDDGEGLAARGFVAASVPPIEGGVKDCLGKMMKIIIGDYEHGIQTQLHLVPALLAQVRDHIRAFYDFKIAHIRSPRLEYCDFIVVIQVTQALHECGLTLQLDPPRLEALMQVAGAEMEHIVLDVGLDVGGLYEAAKKYEDDVGHSQEKHHQWNGRPIYTTTQAIMRTANKDIAPFALCHFYVDIMVALLLNRSCKSPLETDILDHTQRRSKAMQKLVHWSTDKELRRAFAAGLSDAMRPIYWDIELLVEFCQAGGLAALIADSTNFSACCVVARDAFLALPDDAWDDQTEESLSSVTGVLADIRSWPDSSKDFEILCKASYNIYQRYGLEPFKTRVSKQTESDPPLFHYLVRRLERDLREDLITEDDWNSIIRELTTIPRKAEKRMRWTRLSSADRWRCMEDYVCDNPDCEQTIELSRLRRLWATGSGKPDFDEKLDKWVRGIKICQACRKTTYCSQECQKAEWPRHKRPCRWYARRYGAAVNPPNAPPPPDPVAVN
ncbi:hypothetical protein SISSUDRAFT_1055503 [Sistotremastrum suecicum HHB10207 ss-3]|uniref:MYND-type domain-containing protein n=1 Tax=Sistotremastrum suecicum HHB10207 ss-3 TaxID=1314776 RepID=A0A165XR07_9AGAM|nr:hypothetical protein SISSUDRAFT_1055503 [Sistotremastrum suecicum HHB10207 ss-3]